MDPYEVSLLVSVALFLGLSSLIITCVQYSKKYSKRGKPGQPSVVDAWAVSSSLLSTVFSAVVLVFGPKGHMVGYIAGPFVVLIALGLVLRAHRKAKAA